MDAEEKEKQGEEEAGKRAGVLLLVCSCFRWLDWMGVWMDVWMS